MAFAWIASIKPPSNLRRALTPGLPRRNTCAFQRDFPGSSSLAAIRSRLFGTLLRGEMSPGLVQTGRLPCRSTLRPRWALRLASVASPRCLESTSTTDVRTTSTRREHHFWRLPAGERGKPAALRLRDRLRRGVLPPSSASSAGPPFGHPASNGRALDGAKPASGRSSTPSFGAFAPAGKSAEALSACGSSVDRAL